MLKKAIPYFLLLASLLVSINACENEQPVQVITPVPELVDKQKSSNQVPGSKLYKANTCLKMSEILYEGYLYGLPTEDSIATRRQSEQACKEILINDPDDIQAHLNLIGSKYLLLKYTHENLVTEKVEEIVRKGVDEGFEEARLLMGMMVGNKYFKDPLHRVEILLPLLKSKDPKMLAAVGIDMQLEKSSRYDSLDLSIAHKYLPMRLFEEAKSLNNILVRNYVIAIHYRQNFNYKIAALAFEKAYSLNKDILAGYELAVALMDSKGVKRDTAKALELLHSVLDRGSPKGYFKLALIYSIFTNIGNDVDGFVKDEIQSIYFFEEAAKKGSVAAKSALANIYLDDTLEYYDKVRGINWYCQIPSEERHILSGKTVLSQKAIEVNCATEIKEQ